MFLAIFRSRGLVPNGSVFVGVAMQRLASANPTSFEARWQSSVVAASNSVEGARSPRDLATGRGTAGKQQCEFGASVGKLPDLLARDAMVEDASPVAIEPIREPLDGEDERVIASYHELARSRTR